MRSLSATQHAPLSTSPLLGYQNGAFPCHLEVAYRKTDFLCALLQRRELNAGRVLLRAELGELGHLLNLIYSERDLRERHRDGRRGPGEGPRQLADGAQGTRALRRGSSSTRGGASGRGRAGGRWGGDRSDRDWRRSARGRAALPRDGGRCDDLQQGSSEGLSLSALLARTTTRAPPTRAAERRRLR